VPFLDSTAANVIKGIAEKARRRGVRVALTLTGTSQPVRRALLTHGARPPLMAGFRATVGYGRRCRGIDSPDISMI
jgi:SulP family sulfate permease